MRQSGYLIESRGTEDMILDTQEICLHTQSIDRGQGIANYVLLPQVHLSRPPLRHVRHAMRRGSVQSVQPR